MPCSNCAITWMQAGLEYPNGSYANANTSLLLHHTFMANTAQPDAVCGSNASGERFFASGNERLVADISVNGFDHHPPEINRQVSANYPCRLAPTRQATI